MPALGFVASFLSVMFGMALLGERPGLQFYIALVIMIVATGMIVDDSCRMERGDKDRYGTGKTA